MQQKSLVSFVQRCTALLLVAAAALWAQSARAGGFDFPDNDPEAFARGATFTAKADDPMAIEYNIAGLARMRGTHMLLGGELLFHSYEFKRAGTYPQENQPYAGQPFPTIHDQNSIMGLPDIAVSTDFNYFERWTFALGIFAPHSNGGRDFGPTVASPTGGAAWPSPGRYDLTSTQLLIVFPTLAAAVRVTKWLDLGLAVHLVTSSFTIQNISTVPNSSACPTLESTACDAPTKAAVSGNTVTGAFGAMLHPIRPLSIGVNLRGPAYIVDKGTLTSPGSMALPVAISGPATFKTYLPWTLRGGVRWAFRQHGFEQGDIEIDADYEAWKNVEGAGDHLSAYLTQLESSINTLIVHHYRDTGSIRIGGAYNAALPTGVLTARAGFWYESAATRPADTRLDFDTMAKLAPTVGLGYTIRGVSINLAYGYVYEFSRTVTNGDLQALNGQTGTNTTGATATSGTPLPVVNNGYYHATNQVLGLSLGIHWEELLKKAQKRVFKYDVEND